MKNIAVIGSGTMGNGIAHVFAQFGYKVNLIDVNADALKKAIDTISKNLDRQIAKEKRRLYEEVGVDLEEVRLFCRYLANTRD